MVCPPCVWARQRKVFFYSLGSALVANFFLPRVGFFPIGVGIAFFGHFANFSRKAIPITCLHTKRFEKCGHVHLDFARQFDGFIFTANIFANPSFLNWSNDFHSVFKILAQYSILKSLTVVLEDWTKYLFFSYMTRPISLFCAHLKLSCHNFRSMFGCSKSSKEFESNSIDIFWAILDITSMNSEKGRRLRKV